MENLYPSARILNSSRRMRTQQFQYSSINKIRQITHLNNYLTIFFLIIGKTL